MALSGNKVRKLEFLLADAVERGCDSVVTIGGVQSNHCRATAVAARKHTPIGGSHTAQLCAPATNPTKLPTLAILREIANNCQHWQFCVKLPTIANIANIANFG